LTDDSTLLTLFMALFLLRLNFRYLVSVLNIVCEFTIKYIYPLIYILPFEAFTETQTWP